MIIMEQDRHKSKFGHIVFDIPFEPQKNLLQNGRPP